MELWWKIFNTIHFLGCDGLPFRGTYDADEHIENAKFMKLLRIRSNDIPELKSWLKRSSYKWLHHSNVVEILKLMSDYTLNTILTEVKDAKYYAIMIDEISDISRLEQVSTALKYVTDDLTIREVFLGFYETKVKDVLIRFQLNLSDCRGQ